ncbi:MAG: pseudouridine synthase, partial [Clostridiales bacterium]|nr:pseudouridine synthase [Clostridiales bacterium]
QVPRMFSDLKLNVNNLYHLARAGKTVERPPRPVTIYALELGEELGPGAYALRVRCSKGTYIRTLCHDIGQALGCGGAMAALRRTQAAGFTLADALTLEQVAAAVEEGQGDKLLRPIDTLFAQYPAVTVSGRQERLCRNGNPFRLEGADGRFRVYGADGTFLMLGERKAGEMRTVKSFFEPESI